MKLLGILLLATLLIPSMVSADMELQGDIGACTIVVDGEVTSVDYDGYSVFNFDGEQTTVSVFDAYSHDSLILHGDVSNMEVVVCVDANAEESTLTEVMEAPKVRDTDSDSGNHKAVPDYVFNPDTDTFLF